MSKKRLIIVLACLLLISSFITLNNLQHVESASNSKVLKGRSYIQKGKDLYYKTGIVNGNVKLVTRKVDSEKERIITNISTGDFYVFGDYIYYSMKDGFYRIHKDGVMKTRLYKGTAKIIGIYDSYIYYSYYKGGDNYIARMIVNGEQNEILCKVNSLTEAVLAFDRIYYIGNNGKIGGDNLSFVTLDGKVKKELIKEGMIYDLHSDENGVYYIFTDETSTVGLNNIDIGVYGVDKDDKQTEYAVVNDMEVVDIHLQGVYDGILYYSHIPRETDSKNLYTVPTSGGKSTLLVDASEFPRISDSHYFGEFTINNGTIVIGFDGDESPWKWYYLNIDGSDVKLLDNGAMTRTVDILDDSIYYAGTDKEQESIEDYQEFQYKMKQK